MSLLRRLWCRVAGHRWEDIGYLRPLRLWFCPRCGKTTDKEPERRGGGRG